MYKNNSNNKSHFTNIYKSFIILKEVKIMNNKVTKIIIIILLISLVLGMFSTLFFL